jgi:sec-independent protein translocase protein TatC
MTSTTPEDEIDASQAPLIEHLTELRSRLIKAMAVFVIAFSVCFYFANEIFNFLLYPYQSAVGPDGDSTLIFTAPQEFLFTQLKLALFGALALSFPVIAGQLYMFVAPGLYKNERSAFIPFLIATPILFIMGGSVVYFIVMPLAMAFFLSMQQTGGDGQATISLLPRVSEYLSLIMTLIFAFGLVFQLPIVLTLLAKARLVTPQGLRAKRKYAIVATFAAAAFLTPPDPVSQIGLAIPTLLLYELSILSVAYVVKKQAERDAEDGLLDDDDEEDDDDDDSEIKS